MITNKKIKKLLRDPRLFFRDMLTKRLSQIGFFSEFSTLKISTRKKSGLYQYVVVSGVYNVEKYLDYYFRTLTEQTLNFKEHIHLVMVDDGSKDSSAEIIHKWQKKFPKNISYIHKENGGQASARNVGLEYLSENFFEFDYVTFIDPDDFIAKNYFYVVDQFLIKNQNKAIRMIGLNLIFYREVNGLFQDTHPLRYRFKDGNKVVDVKNMGNFIQLSAASAFFELDVIHRNKLRFEESIRPSFEDCHFVGRFLAFAMDGFVAFLKDAKYFYRKREDGTSTLDTAWSDPRNFNEVLSLGDLGLFKFYQERFAGEIPLYIQRTVLYDTFWKIKALINCPERISTLTQEQQKNFISYLDEIYSSIDSSTILEFELAGAWFYHKVGMLSCFKHEKPPFQIVYVDAYDPVKKQIRLCYFSGSDLFEEFTIDGRDETPIYSKTARHDFLDRTFVFARYVWLTISEESTTLKVYLDGQNARISIAGKQYRDGLPVTEIFKQFNSFKLASCRDNDLWLLMDRDTQADDNAEHLYRYIRSQYPNQNICFVLRNSSYDWRRLHDEGFNLLAYGSPAHEAALRDCRKIISSHLDQYVVDYFRDGSLKNKSIIFLQHGVIKDDMSGWFNTKKIDCLITSGLPEYNSLVGKENRYKFTSKEVVLTGLARHDSLLKCQDSLPPEKIILVMPTWRKSLMGMTLDGNIREKNLNFFNSKYAESWRNFLSSARLLDIAKAHQYKIVFFPHANIQPYLSEFHLPSYIDVVSHEQASIQELFCRAAIMVTDFSSVAFDMAVLKKPILYYQFDRDDFYGGGHLWQPGYFDYDKDGFGPVCFDEETVLANLAYLVKQNSKPDSKYLDRMSRFFTYRDGGNCERIYQAIKALDDPDIPTSVQEKALSQSAHTAELFENWPLAEKRWRRLLRLPYAISNRAEAQQHLVNSLINQDGRLVKDIQAGFLTGSNNSAASPLKIDCIDSLIKNA